MITRDTVFVVGAGASCPYGFPTGNGLRNLLCDNLTNEASGMFQSLAKVYPRRDEIRLFAQAFLASRRVSIDAFLAHRSDFREVGVTAIANALLPRETMLGLDRADGGKMGDGDWYQYLFERMLNGVEEPDDFSKNKVQFITFNYDRSLEVFLQTGLQNNFNLERNEAHALLPPIHHVYGSLGEYNDFHGFQYGAITPDRIIHAARSIKTVPSERPSIDTTASAWLKAADIIYFVGFGFDEMNCRRLGVADLVAERSAIQQQISLLGTGLGMTSAEQTIAQRYTGCVTAHGQLLLHDLNALAFIRTYAHQFT